MIKRLLLVFVALLALNGFAQQDVENASPYSLYGVGSLKFKGTVENRSMGGLGVYNDSIHINLTNPASYASANLTRFGNIARPVKFAVGGSHTTTNLQSETTEDRINSTTFDYIALSLPVGRFGVGLGLMPYTKIGYKLQTDTDFDSVDSKFTGSGGLNRTYLTVAYLITDGLSFGVDVNYNFGKTETSYVNYLYDDEDVIVQYQSRERNNSNMSGLNVNLGLAYRKMVTDKLEMMTSLTYQPKSHINSRNERFFETITIASSDQSETVINTIEADLASNNLRDTELILPSKLSFGGGIGQPLKWFVGAEFTTQNMKDFENQLYNSSNSAGNVSYENSTVFSLGGFYIPEYDSYSKYLKRMTYRSGVRFEKTGLNINGESIKEFGISFGLGLPMNDPRVLSNANFGIEIGKRGTINNNLIQENFINFQISLSLNDRWFQRTKFN